MTEVVFRWGGRSCFEAKVGFMFPTATNQKFTLGLHSCHNWVLSSVISPQWALAENVGLFLHLKLCKAELCHGACFENHVFISR